MSKTRKTFRYRDKGGIKTGVDMSIDPNEPEEEEKDAQAERKSTLVKRNIKQRIEGKEEFTPKSVIEPLAMTLTAAMLRDREMLEDHLYHMVRAYVGNTLYSMVSSSRPGAGRWREALQGGEDNPEEADWFESCDGTFKRLDVLDPEEMREVAAKREKRIQGQIEAVRELRAAADRVESGETLEQEPMEENLVKDNLAEIEEFLFEATRAVESLNRIYAQVKAGVANGDDAFRDANETLIACAEAMSELVGEPEGVTVP